MKAFPKSSARRVRFESFELDLDTAELLKNGRRVRLQDQPARLLSLLAGRPGELVSRSEIQKTLWEEGRFVEFDHAVNTAIKKVREALDDDPEKPRIVETLPRKGYRFIAPVEWVEDAVPSDEPELSVETEPEEVEPPAVVEPLEAPDPLPPRRLWLLAAALLVVMLVGGVVLRSTLAPTPNTTPEMRLEIMTPSTADPTSVAISPDGLKVVFVAISEGRSQLRLPPADAPQSGP